MKDVNPKTLLMTEVNRSKLDPVYLVVSHGCWENEPSLRINAFNQFKNALKEFKRKVDDSKIEFSKWCDEDQVEDTIEVNEQKESARFEIYQRGNYMFLHENIFIQKMEVR
ncbi:MAG: hypothetical protein K2P14_10405 [Anaeroplasmataceae bacterium]|nr:hypothetical protein [Anaeroplasmataceae bacterium]